MNFWDILRKNPVTTLLHLNPAHRDWASILPEDQAAAHATQRGHGQISDPPQTTGQGVNQAMAHDDQPPRPARRRNSGRLDGCRGLGRQIGIGIAAIIGLALCAIIGVLTLKVGPEILILLICLALCLAVPVGGGIIYVVYQRSQSDEDE